MKAWRKYLPWVKSKQIFRAPRIKLGVLENCWLIYQEENLIQKFALQNISTSGLGFTISGQCPFEINSTYEITLNLGDKKTKARFRVVYFDAKFLGATFDQSHQSLTADIYDYLKVQITAHALLPVNDKFLASELRGKATWLTDGRYNEIFFIVENNLVTSFQISFLGNHLTGGLNKELLFGRVNHHDDLEPWIDWKSLSDNEWKYTLPQMAKQFLQQVASISEPAKHLLESAIETSLIFRSEK